MSMIGSIKRLKPHYRIVIASFLGIVALATALVFVGLSESKRGRKELLAFQEELRIDTTRSKVDELLRERYSSLEVWRKDRLDLITAEFSRVGPDWVLFVAYDHEDRVIACAMRTENNDQVAPQGAPQDKVRPGLEEIWKEKFGGNGAE